MHRCRGSDVFGPDGRLFLATACANFGSPLGEGDKKTGRISRMPAFAVTTRRRFLALMATAGATPLLFRASYGSAAEGEMETNRLTLAKTPALCTAPQFIT